MAEGVVAGLVIFGAVPGVCSAALLDRECGVDGMVDGEVQRDSGVTASGVAFHEGVGVIA